MLNVGKLTEGFVLDHIQAGRCMDIYQSLGLDKLDCCVAIIKNAKSKKMGKKDIIKIDGGLDLVDLDILGFIDHNITVNIIKNGGIVEKKELTLPKTVRYSTSPMRRSRYTAVNIVKKNILSFNNNSFTNTEFNSCIYAV